MPLPGMRVSAPGAAARASSVAAEQIARCLWPPADDDRCKRHRRLVLAIVGVGAAEPEPARLSLREFAQGRDRAGPALLGFGGTDLDAMASHKFFVPG